MWQVRGLPVAGQKTFGTGIRWQDHMWQVRRSLVAGKKNPMWHKKDIMWQVRRPNVSGEKTTCWRSEDHWYRYNVTKPYVADKTTTCGRWEDHMWHVRGLHVDCRKIFSTAIRWHDRMWHKKYIMWQVRRPHVSGKKTTCWRSEDHWYRYNLTKLYVADKTTACGRYMWIVGKIFSTAIRWQDRMRQVGRRLVAGSKNPCGTKEDIMWQVKRPHVAGQKTFGTTIS